MKTAGIPAVVVLQAGIAARHPALRQSTNPAKLADSKLTSVAP